MRSFLFYFSDAVLTAKKTPHITLIYSHPVDTLEISSSVGMTRSELHGDVRSQRHACKPLKLGSDARTHARVGVVQLSTEYGELRM